MFDNGPGDLGSVSGHVIPKTLKWYLIPPYLTLSNMRFLSRVKWSNPGNESRPPRHLDVVAIEKGAFWLPSTTVANFTLLSVTGCSYWNIYWFWYYKCISPVSYFFNDSQIFIYLQTSTVWKKNSFEIHTNTKEKNWFFLWVWICILTSHNSFPCHFVHEYFPLSSYFKRIAEKKQLHWKPPSSIVQIQHIYIVQNLK